MKDKKTPAIPRLAIDTTTQATAERVTGVDSCNLDRSASMVIARNATEARVIRLLLLNIVLVFALAICVFAVFLTRATSHLMTSVATTLVAAVIAIVTNCFLSIGKRLVSRRQIFNKYIFPRSDVTSFLWKFRGETSCSPPFTSKPQPPRALWKTA